MSPKESSAVHSPAHYRILGMEVIHIIKERSALVGGYRGYLYGNAIKYLLRWPLKKHPLEDLKKCRKHIDWLIDTLEEESDHA